MNTTSPVSLKKLNNFPVTFSCSSIKDVNEHGFFSFQECKLTEDEENSEITLNYGFSGYDEESCGSSAIYRIEFICDGVEFGCQFLSEKDMLENVICLIS
jgi:hypothetical protein